MYLGDFREFLRKHQSPHSRLAVMTMGREPYDAVTIIDEHKYERHYRNAREALVTPEDWIMTGHSWADWARYCFICNVSLWSQNWVPRFGNGEGVEDPKTGEWIIRPGRGYEQALQIALKEGCLRPTRELLYYLGMTPLQAKATTPHWARIYGDL